MNSFDPIQNTIQEWELFVNWQFSLFGPFFLRAKCFSSSLLVILWFQWKCTIEWNTLVNLWLFWCSYSCLFLLLLHCCMYPVRLISNVKHCTYNSPIMFVLSRKIPTLFCIFVRYFRPWGCSTLMMEEGKEVNTKKQTGKGEIYRQKADVFRCVLCFELMKG